MTSSPLASLPALRALSGTARDIALRQDAVATTAQLESWGLTQELASRRARNGEWQRVFQGGLGRRIGLGKEAAVELVAMRHLEEARRHFTPRHLADQCLDLFKHGQTRTQ